MIFSNHDQTTLQHHQGRFYVGAGGTCPQIHLLPPDSLADRSDVISEVPKCCKIQIFQGSAQDPAWELTALPRPSN